MNGIPEIRPGQTSYEEPQAASAPPPPTEVKIRTMRSDLAGLTASGGGLPKFENVKVAGLSLDTKMDTTVAHQRNAVLMIAITCIALIILGVLGYFGYKILTGGA